MMFTNKYNHGVNYSSLRNRHSYYVFMMAIVGGLLNKANIL